MEGVRRAERQRALLNWFDGGLVAGERATVKKKSEKEKKMKRTKGENRATVVNP